MSSPERSTTTSVLSDVARTVRGWPIFACYIAATLFTATIIGLITVNVIDLGMQHFGEAAHRTHDVAYGALFTTLVVGVAVQLRRPHANVAGIVMALVPSAALLLTAVLVDDIDRVFEFNPLRYAAAMAAVTALLHPSGRNFFRSFRLSAISRPLATLVGVAAVPLLAFASSNLRIQRGIADAHTFMGHYGFMAALAFTAVAVGVLASLRPAGWRLTAWVSALLVAVLGATSLLYPDAASSLDTPWAAAAAAWAAAFAAISTRESEASQAMASGVPETADLKQAARSRVSR